MSSFKCLEKPCMQTFKSFYYYYYFFYFIYVLLLLFFCEKAATDRWKWPYTSYGILHVSLCLEQHLWNTQNMNTQLHAKIPLTSWHSNNGWVSIWLWQKEVVLWVESCSHVQRLRSTILVPCAFREMCQPVKHMFENWS